MEFKWGKETRERWREEGRYTKEGGRKREARRAGEGKAGKGEGVTDGDDKGREGRR